MRNRATADTGSPSARAEAPQDQQPDITDEASLLLWLMDQSPEVAIAIASRTELRISPLVVHAAQGQPVPNVQHIVSQLASPVFRVGALARVCDPCSSNTAACESDQPGYRHGRRRRADQPLLRWFLRSPKTAVGLRPRQWPGEAKPSALSAVNAALDATVGLSAPCQLFGQRFVLDAIAAQSLKPSGNILNCRNHFL